MKRNVLHSDWISLLNGRVPTDSNHQIDGVVNRNEVTNQLRVDFESANETFADSGNESYPRKRKVRIIRHAKCGSMKRPLKTAGESFKYFTHNLKKSKLSRRKFEIHIYI